MKKYQQNQNNQKYQKSSILSSTKILNLHSFSLTQSMNLQLPLVYDTLNFINKYNIVRSISNINFCLSNHKIIGVDTSIYNQLKQIAKQFYSPQSLKEKCLKERSQKVIIFIKQLQILFLSSRFIEMSSRCTVQPFNLTKLDKNINIQIGQKIPNINQFYCFQDINQSRYQKLKNQNIRTTIKQDCCQQQKQTTAYKRNQQNMQQQYTNLQKSNQISTFQKQLNYKYQNNIFCSYKTKHLEFYRKRLNQQNSFKKQKSEEFKKKIQKDLQFIKNQIKLVQKKSYQTKSQQDFRIQQLEYQIRLLNNKHKYLLKKSNFKKQNIINTQILEQPSQTKVRSKSQILSNLQNKKNLNLCNNIEVIPQSKYIRINSYLDASKRNYWKRNDYNKKKDISLCYKIVRERSNKNECLQNIKKSLSIGKYSKKILQNKRTQDIWKK